MRDEAGYVGGLKVCEGPRSKLKRDHMMCIDDDSLSDFAHDELTRVEAGKRCVLVIQGQFRMGTAVLTICNF